MLGSILEVASYGTTLSAYEGVVELDAAGLGPVALTVVVPPAMASVWSAFSPVALSSSSVSGSV